MSDTQPIILIVDDDPTNIHLLRHMLREKYKIKAATSGQKALEIAATEPRPDIILLDIMMPGIDGYEVCRQLKTDPNTQPIPVIFITGKSDVEDEQKGFDIGAVDYIIKPFILEIVKSRVQRHLALYAEHQKREH